MTSDKHPSGTDRIGEVLERLGKEGATFDLVVNIQGDEPFIDPSQIDLAVSAFSQDEVQISTLVRRINSKEELFSPNVVKALVASGGKALCFSRLPVPFLRGVEQSQWADKHVFYKHIGLYAFRSQVLKELVRLQPSPIEMAESLEQMRWIENGYSIYTQVTNFESIAVDTPGDLSKFTNIP
jgi:3-deoxy-manno-octulosonate cytidylyltransferase (CMP-KDO synthetase)